MIWKNSGKFATDNFESGSIELGQEDSNVGAGSDMLLQKIKVGGTVHCSHSYELTDTTTPVQLVFRNGVAGEELGTMTYNVQ